MRMVSAQSTDGLQADIASHTNQNTIKDTANLGDRTKMYVLFLNNHSKLCFSSLIYTAVYFATRKLYES